MLVFAGRLGELGAVDVKKCVAAALVARERAYAPYSGFRVGAALAGRDGRVFAGCNVENISYGLTICAERVALGAAVAAGVREFAGIVIVADTTRPVSPCGACRQVLAEFDARLPVYLVNLRGDIETFSLEVLLPRATTGILDRP